MGPLMTIDGPNGTVMAIDGPNGTVMGENSRVKTGRKLAGPILVNF